MRRTLQLIVTGALITFIFSACAPGGVYTSREGSRSQPEYDSPEVMANVAHCVAVYKFAATALTESGPKEFLTTQYKALEKRMQYNLGTQTTDIENTATQTLVQQMKEARKQEAQGAAIFLRKRVEYCHKAFP